MAITPTDFEKIWSTNASTPAYTFSDADYLEGWDFVGNLPPTRAQWNAIQKRTDEKMKYVFDNFGAPLIANTVAEMTLQNRVYVYMGSEVGYTAGDWYYYDAGTSTWVDGGVYNAVAIVTDTTLTQAGVPADAKATGDAIALKPNSDPTLTISGAAADAKVVGDALSVAPLNETISTSFTDGKTLVSTTGEIQDYNGRSVSGVIETIGASILKISNANSNMRSVVFYDSAQNWLAGLNEAMLGDGDYAIPSGTVYMRYCALTASISDIVLELRNIPTVVSTIYDSIDKRAKSYDWQSKRYVSDEIAIQKVYGVTKFPNNIVDISECVDNEYVVYNTGVFKAGTSYFRTGYLPVTAGVTYKSNVGRNAAWYTSAKVYISGVSGTSIQSGITAPVNSAYLAFSINKSSDGITNPADLYCTSATNYGTTKTQINNLAEWCSGKKINWIGDSIVDGNDFDEEVCNALGLNKQYEYGINGSTISLNGDGTDGRNALCIRYANMTDDADIIAVSCGTNDWMYAWAPIGDVSSSVNTTFYGALKTLCEGLINKYPQKVIFFTTPIKRGQAFSGGDGGEYTPDGVMTTPFSKNKYGKTLGDYADIIKEVCGYYSIPVLDMYRESLLNPHITSQQDLFDNVLTHPNTTGQKIMARRVAGWLTQLGYIIP